LRGVLCQALREGWGALRDGLGWELRGGLKWGSEGRSGWGVDRLIKLVLFWGKKRGAFAPLNLMLA